MLWKDDFQLLQTLFVVSIPDEGIGFGHQVPIAKKNGSLTIPLHRFRKQNAFSIDNGLPLWRQRFAVDLGLTSYPIGQMQTGWLTARHKCPTACRTKSGCRIDRRKFNSPSHQGINAWCFVKRTRVATDFT